MVFKRWFGFYVFNESYDDFYIKIGYDINY